MAKQKQQQQKVIRMELPRIPSVTGTTSGAAFASVPYANKRHQGMTIVIEIDCDRNLCRPAELLHVLGELSEKSCRYIAAMDVELRMRAKQDADMDDKAWAQVRLGSFVPQLMAPRAYLSTLHRRPPCLGIIRLVASRTDLVVVEEEGSMA